MLKLLKLKNFRQHRDLEITFTPGLNTLLGSNEAGKSSCLESIFYALFGSDMLRESASEVVSYDMPLNSMRVDLQIEMDGMTYTIYRTPASAEIKYADQIVTGQRATKQFMENLFQCDTGLVKLLIFAGQESVKGIISSDSGAQAGTIVERLADLQVIDDIVARIQSHLPSGNTKVLSGQLAQLQDNLGEPPELPKNEAVLQAGIELTRANDHVENFKPKKAELATKLVALQTELAQAAAVSFSIQKAVKRRDELTLQAKLPADPGITADDVEQARKVAYDQAGAARLRKASKIVFPTHVLEWDESKEAFLQAIEDVKDTINNTSNDIRNLREQRIAVVATSINEDVCSFCKKDISQLPEVLDINQKVKTRVAVLDDALAEAEAALQSHIKDRTHLLEIRDVCSKVESLADPEYWDIGDKIPPKPVWIGGPVPKEGVVPDVKGMQAKLDAYTTAKAAAEAAAAQLALIEVPDAVDDTATKQAIEDVKGKHALILEMEQAAAKARQALTFAESEHASALKLYEYKASTYSTCKQQIADLIRDIGEAEKNNSLIKKLRDTRPAIATELWTIVLGGISYHFSQMRGAHSMVTRDESGFKVNGRSVAGLSGSTQDALGLAVRVALTKTFLPAVPLMVLDEPFHGCDKTRELAGLGLLAAIKFDQTLLVTHSDLADSLSDNLITL